MQEASRPAPTCADQGLRLTAPGTTQGGAPGMAALVSGWALPRAALCPAV